MDVGSVLDGITRDFRVLVLTIMVIAVVTLVLILAGRIPTSNFYESKCM